MSILVLLTTMVPVIFLVLVFTRYQIGSVGVEDYATRMNFYNLIFQMVELLYKLYYTNSYIRAAGCTLKVGAAGCTLTVGAAGNTNCTP